MDLEKWMEKLEGRIDRLEESVNKKLDDINTFIRIQSEKNGASKVYQAFVWTVLLFAASGAIKIWFEK